MPSCKTFSTPYVKKVKEEWTGEPENKSQVLEPIPETCFYFSIDTPVSLSLMCIYCVCECKAGTVCLLALYGSENLIFWKQCKKNIQFAECFIMINDLKDTSVFVNWHAFLLERQNEHKCDKNRIKESRQRGWNSRLFQGFRRYLVLSRVNLNPYFFYSLDIIDTFPLSTPNRIWPLGFKTYEKLDESTMYANFKNTFTLFSFRVWKYSD